ncbi:VTC domain-containing protein [Fennellomyces sp. T-0311]|nr:VTC domain-containing protein [Fennellomyces sp. T-0311]
MKFGTALQDEIFPPWRLSYMQYDMLKVELKQRQLDHEWSEDDEQDFIDMLENELKKVYDFVSAKLGEAEARICYCERTVKSFMSNPRWASEQSWQTMDDALTEVLFDINDLSRFTRINYTGFLKIVKKHDKWTQYDLRNRFVEQLRVWPLDNQRFDVAIVFISALHDICHRRGKPRTGNAAAGGDQSAFERATSKYWIHPDNVTEVQSIILLHLPVLIFNKEKEYESTDSAVSSVYFDNEDFELYTGRLQRDDGAEAIRFRWYGPDDKKSVFIERKTHHAPWLNGVSIKDRFRLDAEDVPKFVSGELTADEYARRLEAEGVDPETVKQAHFVASGIQKSLKEKDLKPMCRIFYDRTAFQLPGDQRVRVSIDTNLTFIREDQMDGKQRRQPGEWHRPDVGINYPFPNVEENDILRFPYAVLEAKIQTHLGQKAPEWLDKLLQSHLVHEVPKFSKYLHGASYLYRDQIPLLPWWLSEMDIDIRKPRETNFGLSRSSSYKPLIDGQYQRAMATEKRRLEFVADSLRRSTDSVAMRSTDTCDKAGKLQVPNNDRTAPIEEKPAFERPYSPRDSAGADTLVEPRRLEAMGGQKNAFLSAYSMSSDGLSAGSSALDYQEAPGATVLEKGDDPHYYGPPAETKEKGGVLGEQVKTNGGDIYLDIDKKEMVTKKKGEMVEPQAPLKMWEKILFGAGNEKDLHVKDDKDKSTQLKKIKIEPKVFFANERTFISWLQFCALLLTVALSLLNFGDNTSRIAGGIFIGIAAIVAIYALYRFEKRAWMINRRMMGRYDDLWGPAVLCSLLVAALIVNFYLRFR